MYVLFNKPSRTNYIVLAIIWAFIIAVAFFGPGCKARKSNKSKSETIDKGIVQKSSSETSEINASAKATDQKAINESVQSNNIYNKEQAKIDTSTKVTEKTKTTLYDENGKIKSTVETEKSTEKNYKSAYKKEAGQNATKQDKTDTSKLDWIENNSEINASELAESDKKDFRANRLIKATETKDNTVYMWIGSALFIVILVFVGYKTFR